MAIRRGKSSCPYCGDPLSLLATGEAACGCGCPIVTCPRCRAPLAPFLNPDGSVPPGPHACPHLAVVAPGVDIATVPAVAPFTLHELPALPRHGGVRAVTDGARITAFGTRLPLLSAWRRLTARPPTWDLAHAIVAAGMAGASARVVHPPGDAADVGAAVFSADAARDRAAILDHDKAMRAGFRDLAARLWPSPSA